MELKDILSSRRSVRKFNDTIVEQSTIDELVAATLTAPSSRNSHSTHLMVIRDRAIIEQMATMRDYGSAFIKGAPIFILVMGDREATDLWEVNCSISASYMQIAATDLGLSSCWVHIDGRPHLKDDPAGLSAEDVVRGLVEIPSTYGVLCGIALGYSDFHPAALPPFDALSRVTVIGE
ncbi:MAG: nitroreductase family protein [Rikenellaceae bacterium]